jgi:hypothetical protein
MRSAAAGVSCCNSVRVQRTSLRISRTRKPCRFVWRGETPRARSTLSAARMVHRAAQARWPSAAIPSSAPSRSWPAIGGQAPHRGSDLSEDWSAGWLCTGCGRALEEPGESPDIPSPVEDGQDGGGSFLRCLHCGGKHYYVPDGSGGTRFVRFAPGTRLFYGLRRKLRLLGPDD